MSLGIIGVFMLGPKRYVIRSELNIPHTLSSGPNVEEEEETISPQTFGNELYVFLSNIYEPVSCDNFLKFNFETGFSGFDVLLEYVC